MRINELLTEGRVLYLTKDPSNLRLQLEGGKLNTPPQSDELCDNISTDDLIPSRFAIEEPTSDNLGKYLLSGFCEGVIRDGEIKQGKFDFIVAGRSFGRGSSRIHAQLALMGAGIKAIASAGSERIFTKNCYDFGIPILDISAPEVQAYLISGQPIPQDFYISTLKPLSRLVIEHGGLLPFTKARLQGRVNLATEEVLTRPMTIAEKIVARHGKREYVRSGQQLLVSVDHIMFYEIQSRITNALLKEYFPEGYHILSPEKSFAFEDHLALVDNPEVDKIRQAQREFVKKHGIRSYNVDRNRGIEGICHTIMTEWHVLPGDLIFGNDSHTSTLGVNNALAVGGGALETAQALLSDEIIITVPESIRFNLHNFLSRFVTAQDVMLDIGRKEEFKKELIGTGRMFEYGGTGLNALSHGQQVKLTNLAIELQGFSGIVEGNEEVFRYINSIRGIPLGKLRKTAVHSDEAAEYFRIFDIDLSSVEPVVALPGDTQNGINLSEVGKIPVDIAYIGSCTGGRLEDLIDAARILESRKIHSNVKMYIQASSRSIYQQALLIGLINIYKNAGAEFILPGCGACMGMGPGTSEKGQNTISTSNRNFKNRMGLGDSYIASAYTVAASAIKGYICSPEDLD